MTNLTNEDRFFALLRQDVMDIEEEAKESSSIYSKDVALLNQHSGSGFVARESGKVEAWAGNSLGFSFDPETDSLTVMATNIVLMTKKIIQVAEPKDYLTKDKQNILFLAKEVKESATQL